MTKNGYAFNANRSSRKLCMSQASTCRLVSLTSSNTGADDVPWHAQRPRSLSWSVCVCVSIDTPGNRVCLSYFSGPGNARRCECSRTGCLRGRRRRRHDYHDHHHTVQFGAIPSRVRANTSIWRGRSFGISAETRFRGKSSLAPILQRPR